MLKTIFSRFNSLNSRHFGRVTRNLSAIEQPFNKENGKSNDKSKRCYNLYAYASLPAYLAFFQKKEEDIEQPAFWEKYVPEEIALFFKKIPVEDESTPEGKLKTTLKRTILCIRKREFQKAEQMAHLALRMAQDMQNYDGITLCYDVMANLAFDTEQYAKAQKLFEEVLQRLIQKGVPQDDIQVLHLSLKVAQLTELQNNKNDAKTNYVWTVTKLDDKVQMEPKDDDLLELRGLASYYYGKFLIRIGKFTDGLKRLQISQEAFLKARGKFNPEYVNILNDLAVAYLHANDFESADKYIDEALALVSAYPDMLNTGIYHANKALICLKKGLLPYAESYCQHACEMSQKSQDPGGIEQAKYCSEELAKAKKKRK